jgi:radical SAM protein with 4Fe4S-binding SPASM domain
MSAPEETVPENPGQASTDPSQPDVGTEIDWDEFRRTGHNPRPPVAMQIETSSVCNFRCDSCPLSLASYDRPEKHMSVEKLSRVLDAFPTVRKIELQGIGEVFLNPCIIEIIEHAASRGLEVHTFSNASKIERDTAYAIVRSGLALVNFSMDGSDEPTFRKLRKGGTLRRYRRCVTNLIEARAALQSATPAIGVMTVLSKRNYTQIPKMLAIAEELGADTIIFTKINSVPNQEFRKLYLGDEERDWIRSLPPYKGKLDVVWAYDEWNDEERAGCYWPRRMTYVTVEGDVTPCCNYYDSRDLSLGNVFEQDGAEIWNGDPYKAFRRRLMNGDLPDKCRNC